MEVTTINAILQILVSILLIWYVIKNYKLVEQYNEIFEEKENIIKRVEDATYKIWDLTGSERPVLDFDLTIRDISVNREKATTYEKIKPEYEKLVLEYPQMEKNLQGKETKIYELEKKLEETKRLYENNGRSLREYVENNYENFDKLAKALNIPFSKGKVIVLEDFTEKIKNMFVAIWKSTKDVFDLQEISKNNLEFYKKRLHAKDQEIYRLRKNLWVKPIKKTGQKEINK